MLWNRNNKNDNNKTTTTLSANSELCWCWCLRRAFIIRSVLSHLQFYTHTHTPAYAYTCVACCWFFLCAGAERTAIAEPIGSVCMYISSASLLSARRSSLALPRRCCLLMLIRFIWLDSVCVLMCERKHRVFDLSLSVCYLTNLVWIWTRTVKFSAVATRPYIWILVVYMCVCIGIRCFSRRAHWLYHHSSSLASFQITTYVKLLELCSQEKCIFIMG